MRHCQVLACVFVGPSCAKVDRDMCADCQQLAALSGDSGIALLGPFVNAAPCCCSRCFVHAAQSVRQHVDVSLHDSFSCASSVVQHRLLSLC
jgi:hypothetical protein